MGSKTWEDLQNISDDDEKFARKLTAEGVPKAVCELLFVQHVEGTSIGGSDHVDLECVCEEVFRNVEFKSLALPEFEYPEGFPAPVDGDGITLYGTPDDEERPNMLLAGLEESDPVYLAHETMKKKLQKSMTNVPCAYLRYPGRGRLVSCELLTHRFGFLSTVSATTSQNPGSRDFSEAIGYITTGVDSKAKTEWNGTQCESFVGHHLACVLLSRVLVLKTLFSVVENLTPYRWLLAPLYPKAYFDGADVFVELYMALSKNTDAVVDFVKVVKSLQNQKLLDKIGLLAFVDEAQLMSGLCKDRF